jgi:DNA polymerase-1
MGTFGMTFTNPVRAPWKRVSNARNLTPAPPDAQDGDLRQAIVEALALGAEFHRHGDHIGVVGDIPDKLRERLPADALWIHTGAALEDQLEQDFAVRHKINPLLIDDPAYVNPSIAAMDGAEFYPIDLETVGSPLPPLRFNNDGSIASYQLPSDGSALDPFRARIATLQLTADGENCFIFRGEALIELLAGDWLAQQSLVAHNATFELSFLIHHAGFNPRRVDCSMLAGKLAFGLEYGIGLDATCRQLKLPVPPKTAALSPWDSPRLSLGKQCYAASDVALLYRAWPLITASLRQDKRWYAYELERAVLPAVAAMKLRGVGFDVAAHQRIISHWRDEREEARIAYQHAADGGEPPSTPRTKQDLIRRIVPPDKLPAWPRTKKTGQLSTAGAYFKRLEGDPAVAAMLVFNGRSKLLSTYDGTLTRRIHPLTGRIHANYNIAKAKTGRFSCDTPNLQYLPKNKAPEFRETIVPAEGRMLLVADWNQIELRGGAWLFQDPVMTSAFADGLDFHTLTAAHILGIDYAAITAEQRSNIKPVVFGSMYGISAASLIDYALDKYNVVVSLDTAQEMLNHFNTTYKVMRTGQHALIAQTQRLGYIDIGVGRRLFAKNQRERHFTESELLNYPIQGICADCMMRALILLHPRLRRLDAHLVCVVHDEVLVEAREDDAERVATVLKATMLEALSDLPKSSDERGGHDRRRL